MLDPRSLRYLLAVVDTGSVTAAAARCHVTQPALSRHLARIERELGFAVFDRSGHRLTLTAAGHRFAPIARDLDARARAAAGSARALAQGRLDSIGVTAARTTTTDVIAPFVATRSASAPLLAVNEVDPAQIFAGVGTAYDLGISTRPPPVHLAARTLTEVPVWLYVPRTHRWGRRRSVRLAELVQHPLCLLPPQFPPRRVLDDALERAALRLGPHVEAASGELAQALAASGRGAAVVSDDERFDLHPALISGPDGPLTLRIYAGWDAAHHAAAAIGELVDALADFCSHRYPSIRRRGVADSGADRRH